MLLADIEADAAVQIAEQSKSLASNPEHTCLSTRVDVVDVASVDEMVNLAVETFGRVDYCVSALGVTFLSSSPPPPPAIPRVLVRYKNTFANLDFSLEVDVAEYVPFHETTPEDYDRVLGINTKGPFLVTRAVGRAMLAQEPAQVNLGRLGIRDVGRGSIVTVSSAMALVAAPAKAPYTTSKHAVTGVARAAGNTT